MISKKIQIYSQIINKIKNSKNIAIVSHINPDLDTIWRTMWLYQIIKDNFLYKNIDLICKDDIPKNFSFLLNINKFKKSFNPKDYDLIFFLDTSNPSLTWFLEEYKELFEKKYNTISIDHHISNTLFSKQNILNATYTSTTMIIWEIFYLLWYKITSISSTYLLAWLYTDSLSFQTSNTNNITYFIASKLVWLGRDRQLIVDKIFKTKKLNSLRLYWEILSNSFIDEENILYAYINKTSLDDYNLNYEDTKWVLDLLTWVLWVKYVVFLTQKWDFIKWSLRTLRDDIDLNSIAFKYWWWGHKKASWFTISWELKETKTLNFKI